MRNHRRRNPDFATAIKEAEANAERLFLSRILKHSEKQWTAAAWLAERRFPERWKRHDTVKVDVPGGETVGQAAALLRDLAEIKRRSGSTPPANG